jgi:NTE family protein
MEQVQQFAPREEFLDFPGLLQKHVRFEELETLIEPSSPRLLLGAVDVLSGDFKAFDSQKNEITLKATLASAAIPTLFQAVEIDGQAYWDGLFSENPPVNSFLQQTDTEFKPTEIWIIQINPTERSKVPQSTQDILDRRNELAGNLSLFHAIKHIKRINKWIDQGFTKELKEKKGYQAITLRKMMMSKELMEKLDYASKIDRSESHMEALIEDGELQANNFLDDLDGHIIPDNDC